MRLAFGFIFTLLIIVPLWKIFKKTGHHPAFSLLIFIPLIGAITVLCILAFTDWPNIPTQQPGKISA